VIRVSEVCKTYVCGDHRIAALEDVSLEVGAGTIAALVGRSGSGKSTLVNLLGGLDRPDRGSIEVAGRELVDLDGEELAAYRRRTVGMVFQAFNLVATLSAAANVELPLVFEGWSRTARRRRSAELLERVGLSERAAHRPAELSGGEQQRVALARALATGPSVLLADEPTGNLDSATAKEVVDLLAEARAQGRCTVVLVTHDVALAESVADCIVRLDDGRIVA
jgi:ABC-type lipoprotein export system ATPase subunit